MLEKQIEEKVNTYAKTLGFAVYKFNSMNRAAVPDRMYVHPSGFIFFIEFKRGGAKPTPAQEREHARLRALNVKVYVVDDVDSGKRLLGDINAFYNRFDIDMTASQIRAHRDDALARYDE